jgi:branched-chain amino acid transport system substrate-binding protein
MRKRTGKTAVAGIVVAALVAASCGDDDDAGGDADAAVASTAGSAGDSTEPATGATDPAGTSAGSSAPADCELDDSPLVVGLYEVQGESAVAVNSFDFGSKLAVQHINEGGGICGQELRYDRTAPSISDAQVANAAFLEAVDMEPTAMMGIPAPNQLAGLQAQIERAGIPTLSTSGAADQAFYGAEGVSVYNWKLANPDKNYVSQTVAFATEDLGLERIALMGTTDLAPSTMEVAQGLVPESGGEVTVALPYNPTSNDLTPQILQVKGADGLIHYCYPNTCAVQLNQFEQNGITMPTITTSSLTFVANVLVEGPALQNAYAVFSGCVLSADSDRPGVADFYNAYVEEFDEEPNQGALQTYNGMMIIKKAIELAGTTDPEALNEALGEVSVTTEDGVVCDDEYHADGAHYFFHDTIVVEYNEDGTSTEVKRVTNPDDDAVS